ncbi:hypothetical protein [Rhizobium halophytocola]|uniref:Uncharacterized protein n=1 Tax=Rhizobium halophytocola TaxID=735519 RepID=A0ABS4DWD0_9HYPH|nr:hypothetical protein [Rhizobium halophytocola]MBP1850013.1 hypothetical protein [Rhizobium halophytocola]
MKKFGTKDYPEIPEEIFLRKDGLWEALKAFCNMKREFRQLEDFYNTEWTIDDLKPKRRAYKLETSIQTKMAAFWESDIFREHHLRMGGEQKDLTKITAEALQDLVDAGTNKDRQDILRLNSVIYTEYRKGGEEGFKLAGQALAALVRLFQRLPGGDLLNAEQLRQMIVRSTKKRVRMDGKQKDPQTLTAKTLQEVVAAGTGKDRQNIKRLDAALIEALEKGSAVDLREARKIIDDLVALFRSLPGGSELDAAQLRKSIADSNRIGQRKKRAMKKRLVRFKEEVEQHTPDRYEVEESDDDSLTSFDPDDWEWGESDDSTEEDPEHDSLREYFATRDAQPPAAPVRNMANVPSAESEIVKAARRLECANFHTIYGTKKLMSDKQLKDFAVAVAKKEQPAGRKAACETLLKKSKISLAGTKFENSDHLAQALWQAANLKLRDKPVKKVIKYSRNWKMSEQDDES